MLISPQPDQEENKLQRQNILMFIYPTYNHNWRNISTIYMCITRLAPNEIFSPSNKIHREVGQAKNLSACRNRRLVWTVVENLDPNGIRSPDRTTSSQFLYLDPLKWPTMQCFFHAWFGKQIRFLIRNVCNTCKTMDNTQNNIHIYCNSPILNGKF